MDLKETLNRIYNGIGFPVDRHLPPAKCSYIPSKEEDLKVASPVTYERIDGLVVRGLVRISERKGYANALLTYEGRKLQLELQNWNRNDWYYKNRACCEKALPVFCVCTFKTICPDHGGQCS